MKQLRWFEKEAEHMSRWQFRKFWKHRAKHIIPTLGRKVYTYDLYVLGYLEPQGIVLLGISCFLFEYKLKLLWFWGACRGVS